MQRLRSKAKSNQLEIGDRVTIGNRFFTNRGLKRSLVGAGEVISNQIPYVRVRFRTHHIFIYCKTMGYIKSLVFTDKDTAVVEINGVYLEKIK
jgi:hypothetical protein